MGRVSVLREPEKTWGAVSGVDPMDEREREELTREGWGRILCG